MKTLHKLLLVTVFLLAGMVTLSFYCCTMSGPKADTNPADMTIPQMIDKGKYLVTVGGCNDCHSPKIMTQMGPVVDSSKMLSGSPADLKLAPIDTNQIAPGKWYLGAPDLTSWVGPWGISYSANLTPDSTTGLGGITEATFIKIIRGGKFMGVDAGRPLMPPMSTDFAKVLSDNDLKCIFAYLHSLKPVKNRVHDYVPPPGIKSMM
jgi:hypothetical protein